MQILLAFVRWLAKNLKKTTLLPIKNSANSVFSFQFVDIKLVIILFPGNMATPGMKICGHPTKFFIYVRKKRFGVPLFSRRIQGIPFSNRNLFLRKKLKDFRFATKR